MTSPSTQGQWLLRLVTTLIWTLAAASVLYWGLRVVAGPGAGAAAPETPSPAFAADAPARRAALARVLGAVPPAAAAPEAGAAQRFTLLGVIASVTGQGAALISVDGQPARPLTVGAQIAPGYVLEAVSRREAMLVDSAQVPIQIILSLPALEASLASAQPSADVAVAVPALPAAVMGASIPTESPANTAAPATAPRPDSEPPARQDSRYPSLRR